MIVYISGPITDIPDGNRPAFAMAELRLIEQGHYPINPHNLCDDLEIKCETWLDFMRVDLAAMMRAEAVLALPGWQKSREASIECRLAQDLGISVIEQAGWPT